MAIREPGESQWDTRSSSMSVQCPGSQGTRGINRVRCYWPLTPGGLWEGILAVRYVEVIGDLNKDRFIDERSKALLEWVPEINGIRKWRSQGHTLARRFGVKRREMGRWLEGKENCVFWTNENTACVWICSQIREDWWCKREWELL